LSNATEFHHIALIVKPDDSSEDLVNTLRQTVTFLGERGVKVFPDQHAARALGLSHPLATEEMGHHCDLAIIIGGDGTFLNSARRLGNSQIPLLGVNLGRLGFLVDISPDAMRDTLGNVLDGRYEEEERFLLSCQVGKQAPELALNDVVLHKWNTARMVEFETWVDDSFIDTQRSDGIIVSTPTGSTAYALSVGGPLLTPTLDAIALVPICPHTLSNRPIVVHSRNVVRLRVCGKTSPEHVRVTCDGQVTLDVGPGDDIVLHRHQSPLRLIHPAGHDHFQILRTKLHWGGKHS